jgi:holo-[acyl-carrier protein] synthase
MILGIGSDLVDIRRVEKSLARWGDRFVERCFTAVERGRSDGRRERAASYAKRFAAKEACAKALGTGFSGGVFWRDMGVVNLPGGRPTMALTGGAARRLAELLPPGMTARIELSITDEPPLAQAIVIISAVPESTARDAAPI